MRLVRLALNNAHWAVVAALGVAVLGIVSAIQLPKDLLPVFQVPAVQILTFYPGMPPEVMEKDITSRIQRWTGQSVGIARQESRSMLGVSIVKDFFRPDISFDGALSQVTSYAMSDLYYLPPGTIPPMVMPFDPTASVPLVMLTVTHPTYDETKLYDLAYFNLRNMLQGIPGVIAPAVYGGRLRRILAYVDPERLAARRLSAADVVEALRDSNVLIPTGNAKLGATDYQIVSNAQVESVDEMNDFPIRAQYGTTVRIGDVATVKDAAQIQTNVVRVDGRRQVYIPVYRQPGANTLAVVDGIKGALGEILKRLPEGIKFGLAGDQSAFVRRALRTLTLEVILGGGLAGLMVFAFLRSWHATVAAALAIPLSLLGCFLGLRATGDSLNAMTIGGLALAVGVLIDDAIVVIENIMRRLAARRRGEAHAAAFLTGAGEVAEPILAATATIIIVFLPVVFLSGVGRYLFAPLARSVCLAVGGSYLVAMTIVPLYCRRFLTAPTGTHAEPGWYRTLSARYDRWVTALLTRPAQVAAGAGLLFLISLGLLPFIGRELFPRADQGHLSLHVRLPTGTRIERTEAAIARIETSLDVVFEPGALASVISNLGVLYDWPAAYTPNAGPSDAFMELELSDRRRLTAEAYAARLREHFRMKFPEVELAVNTGGMLTAALNGGLPSPISFQVGGNDLAVSHALAEKLAAEARQVRGAVDVRVQERMDAPQIKLNLDRRKAARLGLTARDIVQAVVTAFNSSVNFMPAFWISPKNGNHYFLGAQYPEEAIRDLDTLRNIPITGKRQVQARAVRLREVAGMEPAKGPTEIRDLNIKAVISVLVNVQGRDVGSVAADIERRAGRLEIPAGYTVRLRGEIADMRESFTSLGFGAALAVLLVYLVLAGQFRSFTDPLLILVSVPLGFVGVVVMMVVTRTSFNIQSLIGVIFMVGIAVRNGILLVEFANREFLRGRSPVEAARNAARTRLRPILMTALAGGLGVLPMAIGFGHGAETNTPLGRAVLGGLAASTVLTLCVLPALFVLVKRRRTTGRGRRSVAVAAAAVLVMFAGRAAGVVLTPVPLSWQEALGRAATHPVIVAARARGASAAYGVAGARAGYLPRLNLNLLASAGLPGSSGAVGVPGVVNSPFRETPSGGVDASWTLWDFGRTAGAVNAARAEERAARGGSGTAESRVLVRLATAYAQAALAARLDALAATRYEDLELIKRETDELVKAGLRSPVDLDLIQTTLIGVSARREELLGVEGRARADLAEAMHAPEPAGWLCAADPALAPAISDEAAWTGLADRLPAVVAARARRDRALAIHRSAAAESWPRVVAVGSADLGSGTRLVPGRSWSAGLGMVLPVFDGARASSRRAAAGHEAAAAESDLEAERASASATLRGMHASAVAADRGLTRLVEQEAVATRAYRLARARYLNREADLPELRDAEAGAARVAEMLAEAEVTAWHARTILDLVAKSAAKAESTSPQRGS